jgi:DNA-binding NarL/FixJ family response regulator
MGRLPHSRRFHGVDIKNRHHIVMKKIGVMLVDDHTVVRQGLRALMAAEEDMEVVGEAENGRQAVALARKNLPDVVVMDIAMPLLNGLEATRQIVKTLPQTKVLALSSYGDDECVAQMMNAGASGFLVKHTAADDLLKAIREVQIGNAFFSPGVAKRLRDQCHDAFATDPGGRKTSELTSREAEVLQLIAEGFSNKQIAAELVISIKTVEKHRQQAMNKLNVHDVAGLTRYAISKGLVERSVPDES